MRILNALVATMTAVVAAAVLTPALAANFEVQMLNQGEGGDMVFEPALITIAVGDTVTFVPTDLGHNAETIKDLLPAGAEVFKGGVSKEIAVTFSVPGAYGIKCTPHLGMGMVALVVVGDEPVDLDAIKAAKLPKPARERMEAIVAQLDAR